jgi:hypothetical protein
MARHKRPLPGYVDIGLTDDEVDVIVEETIEAALNGKGSWHPAGSPVAQWPARTLTPCRLPGLTRAP